MLSHGHKNIGTATCQTLYPSRLQ